MYQVYEELGVTYTFGFAMNARLKAASDELLAQAKKQFQAAGENDRLFLPLLYQAESWKKPRRVVITCEVHSGEPIVARWPPIERAGRSFPMRFRKSTSIAARSIVVRLSGRCPYLNEYIRISNTVLKYADTT